MKKDIFIDNNIAKNFANPVDKEYKKLIRWLIKFDKNIPKEKNAHLVLSKKIQNEYFESSSSAKAGSNIIVITDILKRQGRTNEFTTKQIKQFQQKHFSKTIKKQFNLYQNNRDSYHIPVILMSDRKKALIIDKEFKNTVNNFPGFNAKAESKPREEFYK